MRNHVRILHLTRILVMTMSNNFWRTPRIPRKKVLTIFHNSSRTINKNANERTFFFCISSGISSSNIDRTYLYELKVSRITENKYLFLSKAYLKTFTQVITEPLKRGVITTWKTYPRCPSKAWVTRYYSWFLMKILISTMMTICSCTYENWKNIKITQIFLSLMWVSTSSNRLEWLDCARSNTFSALILNLQSKHEEFPAV